MSPHDDCPAFPSWSECGLRYNIADAEREPGELAHQSEPDLPPIDEEEHVGLMRLVVPVIAKHNRGLGFSDEGGDKDYYYHIAEQFRGDRMTEVAAHGQAEYTVEFILDLQELLRGPFRLWRIVAEAPVRDDAILIYPTCWRNSDAELGEPLQRTLDRVNAHRHSWECLVTRYQCIDRPELTFTSPPRHYEAKIVYNGVLELGRPDWPVFNTAPIAEEPSVDEFLEFEKDLAAAIERHGPVYSKRDLSDTASWGEICFGSFATSGCNGIGHGSWSNMASGNSPMS